MNILIIEDDIILWNNLKKCFKQNNFANIVTVLHSLKDFLCNSSIIYYDIILLDICLWEDNFHGIDILKHIRRKDQEIPIIMMSSYNQYSLLEDAFRLGAHDYIIKPFRSRELQIRIQRWFINYIFLEYYSISKIINYMDLYYNLDTCEFHFWTKKIMLSKSSKYILLVLLIHKEKLVTSEYLIGKIWGDTTLERNVRIKILRLKKYLELLEISHWIVTIRWEWYMLKSN